MTVPRLLLMPLIKTDSHLFPNYGKVATVIFRSMDTQFKGMVVFHVSMCLLVQEPQGGQSLGRAGRGWEELPPGAARPSAGRVSVTGLCAGLRGWKWSRGVGEMEGGRETHKVPINSRCDDRLSHTDMEFSQPQDICRSCVTPSELVYS